MPKRATKTSFQKGKSGNPKGLAVLPKETKDRIALARARFQDFLPDAFGVLKDMFEAEAMVGGQLVPNMALREEAMHIVFNRNLGMVVEKKEISGADGGAIKIEDNTPAIRVLLQAALPLTIEGEKE